MTDRMPDNRRSAHNGLAPGFAGETDRVVSKPRLLDLFCKAGGCTKGYQRAGFYVVGVDIEPQPNYCGDEFYEADALDFMRGLLASREIVGITPRSFVAIHASPPCQAFTKYRNTGNVGAYPDLIAPVRAALKASGVPYVIENVEGAPLEHPVKLCGTGFGLDVRRHRLFESNVPMFGMPCAHGRHAAKRFPGGRSKEQTGSNRGLARATVEVGTWDIPLDVQQRAMGIDWMTLEELSEAIPPAYTEHIGHFLLAEIRSRQEAAA